MLRLTEDEVYKIIMFRESFRSIEECNTYFRNTFGEEAYSLVKSWWDNHYLCINTCEYVTLTRLGLRHVLGDNYV